jgi:hypothetical protein
MLGCTLAILTGACAEPALGQIASGVQLDQIKGAVVPLYVEASREPAAVIRVGSIRKDYERRGFFRIALLPLLVAEDVSVELRNLPGSSNLLAAVKTHLGRTERHAALELKRLTVMVAGDKEPRLKAGTVHLQAEGRWSLRDGVDFIMDGKSVHAPQGDLAVTGPQAGLLMLQPGPAASAFNLFAPRAEPTAERNTALPP